MARGVNRIGGRIDPIPEPEVEIVMMEEVPEPPLTGSWGRWSKMFDQIAALPKGSALKVKVGDVKRGMYIRQQLRDQAKKADRFLSHSRSADSTVFYFWLEPPEITPKSVRNSAQ